MRIEICTDYLFSLKNNKEVECYIKEVADNIRMLWEDRAEYQKKPKRGKKNEKVQ